MTLDNSNNEDWPWYETKKAIAEFIVVKLKDYKANFNQSGMCIPTWLEENPREVYWEGETVIGAYSDEEVSQLVQKWNDELDKMIHGFTLVLGYDLRIRSDIQDEMIQESLDIFAKYLVHLWD